MATKLDKKTLPSGHSCNDFKYVGRPGKDQGDFGSDVGLADMACVNQFGEANNSKGYHGGVVQSSKTGEWFVYLEWGRIKPGKSWSGSFTGQDYQFVQCADEAAARKFFATQMNSKNTKRLEQKDLGGKILWAAKDGSDGYIVQKLATREKGLPDAYLIKDDSGVQKIVALTPKKIIQAAAKSFHQEVIRLAQNLVGGTKSYTRALSQAAGVTPTMEAISEVRTQYIPMALQRIKYVGSDIVAQVSDADLRAITKFVAALVPRPIPHGGISDAQAILSSENIQILEQDLDAFEAALNGENFDTNTVTPSVDPDALLNAQLTWLDPNREGKEIIAILMRQTNNKHSYLSKPMKVLNLFQVSRSDRDAQFIAKVKEVANKRHGVFGVRASLQPKVRPDLTPEETELYGLANVILTQHGTRSVNVSPILQTHFRLPQQLPGALICGANFGHGTYTATDFRKAVGYTSYERSAWAGGTGSVSGRGAFMFLTETLMGDAYLAQSTGSWNKPPNGKDSVFGRGGDSGHALANDEHVVFDPHHNRIRYLVEFTF
jgi:hypothetical protein